MLQKTAVTTTDLSLACLDAKAAAVLPAHVFWTVQAISACLKLAFLANERAEASSKTLSLAVQEVGYVDTVAAGK